MSTPAPVVAESNIDPKLVKQLRDKTNAGMMDCKKALTEAKGDLAAAETILRKKGAAQQQKKAGREAKEGVVGSYIHVGDKVGVLIEINCETDFVARNESFRSFVKDVTLQVAAAAPLYVKRDEVPERLLATERDVASAQEDKLRTINRANIFAVEKVNQAKGEAAAKLEQLLAAKIAELGENIVIRRFTRFQVGEALAGQPAA